MRRPLTVVALVTAVTALVASAAMAVGTLGGRSSGPRMMRDSGQSWGSGMMGGSTMGAAGGMGMMAWLPGDGATVPLMAVNSSSGAIWHHTWHAAFIALEDS